MSAVYDQYKAKGVGMLSINVSWDKEQLARMFMGVYKVTYPVGRDASGTIGKLYGIEATPTSVFIDKVGRLVERYEGGLEEADFRQRLDALLK